ncbi:MAG TPA: NAD(P)-binding domain-containing protein [Rhodopila sp.]|uniref:NAD(P)-binding domain-containing protein n=1 Tax=Rhodopila sp. TaxID=2480087 RepID=UPI002B64CFA9|nr:NAD(P)-binding domain-containing protein [Rhodopila sp.]HVY15172.1 NAD(P)-binding domain-containing protein [Rhodopila sp.]
MSTTTDIAIIGAGPYGLSLAAYLRAAGADFRIFGTPMFSWRTQMPKGMKLKSDGFASSLYDPRGVLPLRAYCAENGIPYADLGLPVPLEVFCEYGLAFQQRMVPMVEEKMLLGLTRDGAAWRLTLDDGETFTARRVVLAIGICHFAYLPEVFRGIDKALVTHSSDHTDLSGFAGKSVAVIGAGASAIDAAALLGQAGAKVEVIARKPVIHFHNPPPPGGRTFMEKVRAPTTTVGPGWPSFLCTHAPLVFHAMPEAFRLKVVRKHLGPAPGWFVREHVEGKMPLRVSTRVERVNPVDGRVRLDLAGEDGSRSQLEVDHVVAGTGYRVDLRRLGFLDAALRGDIRSVEETPVLDSHFGASVKGLYFVGASAANAFGPVLRFACGAEFTAKRLSRHLTARR